MKFNKATPKTLPVESSSLLPGTKISPSKTGVYRFFNANGDKMGTRWADYKKPVIKGKGNKKFIEYYYRVPALLYPIYKKDWERFKVYEDINRNKDDEYTEMLRGDVEFALKNGYNPFEKELKSYKKIANTEPTKEWTIQQGLLYFIQKWEEKGLDKRTLYLYKKPVTDFIDWLELREMKSFDANLITQEHIENFLQYSRTLNKWGNRQYNNTKNFLRTGFIFLKKKKIIASNPCEGIESLRTKSKKHKYYDKQTLERLRIIMQEYEPYLLFAAEIVYYLCIRSEKELQAFKVGNIIPERKQVLIESGKGGVDRYIPLSDEMLKIFKERKILDYPKDDYVLTTSLKPGEKQFGKNYFSKRFAKIRKLAKLTAEHTLYGFKHTRVVHLKLDGASDAEIMGLTGHTDPTSYAKYLRDLGVEVNQDAINAKTRKF